VSGAGDSMMAFISVMFAFLIMAHYFGSKLSSIQAAIISALFIWASAIQIYASVGFLYRAQMFADRLKEIDEQLTFFLSPVSAIVVVLMMLTGIVVCLVFLYQARKGDE
jgi:hypothetical protein